MAGALHDEKYVALTTYRKNGESSSCPVWIADTGSDTVGFTTSSSSLKVKRLRNDARVRLQPSDSKGNVVAGSVEVTGRALLHDGKGFETVAAVVKKKYGIQYTMITLVGKMAKLVGRGSGTDTAVVITLD